MDEHEVVSVTEQANRDGGDWWVVRFRHSDGTEREHFIPKVALDARAAEYGITDVNVLLDVLLAEPYIPDPTDLRNHGDDAAAKAGHTVKAIKGRDAATAGADVPAWLFNAASIADARAAHLARVAHVRAHTVRIKRPPAGARAGSDPLDVIRAAYRPDPAVGQEIAAQVEAERRRLRGERADDVNRPRRPGRP